MKQRLVEIARTALGRILVAGALTLFLSRGLWHVRSRHMAQLFPFTNALADLNQFNNRAMEWGIRMSFVEIILFVFILIIIYLVSNYFATE